MGSRCVVHVCRDAAAAQKVFGVGADAVRAGIVYTRSGRRFFSDGALEQTLLDELRGALSDAGFWRQFDTDWFSLDCELMPWSLKAQALIHDQYAAVGASASNALDAALASLTRAQARGVDVATITDTLAGRRRATAKFIDAYRRYCWPAELLADLKLAPFQLLASAGVVHAEQPHTWHMETLSALCEQRPWLHATAYRPVALADPDACADAVDWWRELTEAGGEGMVVKPVDPITRGKRGLLQPAIKCRGREYLRIIYGVDYDTPENLTKLKQRKLGGKRAAALREFSLGIEALHRFVEKRSFHDVHECALAVLALESEPLDPRL